MAELVKARSVFLGTLSPYRGAGQVEPGQRVAGSDPVGTRSRHPDVEVNGFSSSPTSFVVYLDPPVGVSWLDSSTLPIGFQTGHPLEGPGMFLLIPSSPDAPNNPWSFKTQGI